MFTTFEKRRVFANDVRELTHIKVNTVSEIARGLRLKGWPNYTHSEVTGMLESAGFKITPYGTVVVRPLDEHHRRFACVDSYASFVIMRAAYCAMDFGDTNIPAYIQDCFDRTKEDNLPEPLCDAVRAKLAELGYRW